MTDTTEAQLILAAQSGDSRAMSALLQPWNDRIFGFLLQSLRHHEDAEDAAQEVFSRVVKALPRYEHRGQFAAWIFQIARNQAALSAQRRDRRRGRETVMEPSELEAMPDGTLPAPDYTPLRTAIDQLPAAEREVIMLRLGEDLKFREIAERTGAPLNTVLGRMRNAAHRIREYLTHHENA